MTGKHFHSIVIGSGPGGEGAAMKLAKRGKSVAVIERYREVGGGCTHWGTIPSKALRHSVQRMMDYNASPLFRELSEPRHLSFPQVLRQAESVINKQVGLRFGFYQRNDVPVFFGQATFVDEHTLEVASDAGRVSRFTADHFVLATGSRPYHPEDVDFSAPGVHDSDSILTLKDTPRTITIYGAGVIGSEYASIFRGLGVKVDLVNTRSRLLEFLDDEISDALSYHLREMGTVIRHAESYSRVEPGPDGVTLHLESGKRLKNEVLLWANGRSGNTDAMGLETLDLPPNSRGQLEVNERFQTALPHIYAVGDVIGFPSLASAAYDQGRFAAQIILDGEAPYEMPKEYPTGIYTIPEISSLGRNERDLTAAKVPFEVGHAFFKDLARAQISGHAVGMLKILFHTETLEILGIHCFGDDASEIVHIGQAIMAQPGSANSLRYFMNTTFNYPTMAEAYRVAALNGYNRLD